MGSSGKSSQDAAAAHRAATRALAGFRNVPAPVREELAQEAALRTWQASGVRDPSRFAGRVAQRLAIDWLRRRVDDPAEVADVPEATPWQRRIEAALVLRVVGAMIAEAPELHRETLRRLYVEDVSFDELLEERLSPGADRARERDLLYKRRARALGWIRASVDLAA